MRSETRYDFHIQKAHFAPLPWELQGVTLLEHVRLVVIMFPYTHVVVEILEKPKSFFPF